MVQHSSQSCDLCDLLGLYSLELYVPLGATPFTSFPSFRKVSNTPTPLHLLETKKKATRFSPS